MEREFQDSKDERKIEITEKFESTRWKARIKLELVTPIAGTHPYLDHSKSGSTSLIPVMGIIDRFKVGRQLKAMPITWEAELPQIMKPMTVDVVNEIRLSWKKGYFVRDRITGLANNLSDPERLDLFTSALLGIVSSIVKSEAQILIPPTPGKLSSLKISPDTYAQARLTDAQLNTLIDNAMKRNYWEYNGFKNASEWINRRSGIKPDWYEGLHLCPRCNAYSLVFEPGILFD